MSSGRRDGFAEEKLKALIKDFEALTAELERAIETLAPDPANDESVQRLERAKAAALRGKELAKAVRRNLI